MSDGKEWNIEVPKLKLKKATELGKKGKEYKIPYNITDIYMEIQHSEIQLQNLIMINFEGKSQIKDS